MNERSKKMILLGVLVILLTGCPEESNDPATLQLKQLISDNALEVPAYTDFKDISSITPIPAATKLDLASLARMALLKKNSIQNVIISPSKYNEAEKNIQNRFIGDNAGPELKALLKLVAYSRQLQSNHPYRINPFLPFYTIRSENELLNKQKVGPAALPIGLIEQTNSYQGKVMFKTPQGETVKIDNLVLKPNSVPESGSMFLLDHALFPIRDIFNDKTGIIEDIIIHEFTHIMHGEITKNDLDIDFAIRSKDSETGHDANVISNPYLALIEGLAIGMESLYGFGMAQQRHRTDAENKKFFANLRHHFNESIAKKYGFLINRQEYVRNGSYVYNLYDFSKCSLRNVKMQDIKTVDGKVLSVEEMLAAIKNGQDVTEMLDQFMDNFSFAKYEDRFYGATIPVAPRELDASCVFNPPSRLESNEGFVAGIIFRLMTRALGKWEHEDCQVMAKDTPVKWNYKESYVYKDLKQPELKWPSYTKTRTIASLSEEAKQKQDERFLLAFRELILGLKNSQAGTIGELIKYFLDSDQLSRQEKYRVAFQFLKASHAQFTPQGSVLRKMFKDNKSINDHQVSGNVCRTIYNMIDDKDVDKIVALANQSAPIYVEFSGKLRTSGEKAVKTRININNAHHVDLIDMFKKNDQAIVALAHKLDAGDTFKSAHEFIQYVENQMGVSEKEKVEKMLAQAQASIKENEKLRSSFSLNSIMEPLLRYWNEPLFDKNIRLKKIEVESKN